MSPVLPHHATPKAMLLRLGIATLIGVGAAAIALAVPMEPATRVLVGVTVGMLAYSLPVVWLFARLDPEQTKTKFADLDPTRSEADLVVVLASLASLVGIAVMLIGGQGSPTDAVVAVLTVASAWLAIHTTYTLRYAKHYLAAQPGCIDFNTDDPPRLSDFAYFSFNLGMTYQVSDTDVKTAELRKIVLAHTVLSYVFGTVVIATTINLVVTLAGG